MSNGRDPESARPLETFFHGYRFRSRLEARWAVFFLYLNIPYEYEPEGFNLGEAGYYLPDFWLPQQECWVEIKPGRPSDEETARLEALVNTSGHRGYIFYGAVPYPDPSEQHDPESAHYLDTYGWDCTHWWCECPKCGSLDIQFEGRAERNKCDCFDAEKKHISGYGTRRLQEAYAAARKARFDYLWKGS
jgi:hypothetical protein